MTDYHVYKLIEPDLSLIKEKVIIHVNNENDCGEEEILGLKQSGVLSLTLLSEGEFTRFLRGHHYIFTSQSYLKALEEAEKLLLE